ncbi:MAG: 50S ribosomal protein L13 [Candidatus Woesearchaeota archaeon]
MLIDATDHIVGRLASVVAKKALLGEKIDIINAENAVISGKRPVVFAKMKEKVSRGIPSKGPHFRRSPERLMKRFIRDMLPYKQPKGRAAFENIMCWVGVPEQFKDKKAERIKEAEASKLMINSVSIKEISRFLGGKVE